MELFGQTVQHVELISECCILTGVRDESTVRFHSPQLMGLCTTWVRTVLFSLLVSLGRVNCVCHALATAHAPLPLLIDRG